MNEFKLIIAGGRAFNNTEILSQGIKDALAELPDDVNVAIVSGCAPGADYLGLKFAIANKVKLYKMPAEWKAFGKRAGFKRNVEMANASHGLLAFWDGESKGTKHMIQVARNKGLYVKVVMYKVIHITEEEYICTLSS